MGREGKTEKGMMERRTEGRGEEKRKDIEKRKTETEA